MRVGELTKALKLAAAALRGSPAIGRVYEAEHGTAHAYALAAVQAAIAMAEGAPFDASGTELPHLLAEARDAVAYMLTRPIAADGLQIRAAERTLAKLTLIVGPPPMAGDRPCDTEPA